METSNKTGTNCISGVGVIWAGLSWSQPLACEGGINQAELSTHLCQTLHHTLIHLSIPGIPGTRPTPHSHTGAGVYRYIQVYTGVYRPTELSHHRQMSTVYTCTVRIGSNRETTQYTR